MFEVTYPVIIGCFVLFGLLLADASYKLNVNKLTPLGWFFIVILWPILLPIAVIITIVAIFTKKRN